VREKADMRSIRGVCRSDGGRRAPIEIQRVSIQILLQGKELPARGGRDPEKGRGKLFYLTAKRKFSKKKTTRRGDWLELGF